MCKGSCKHSPPGSPAGSCCRSPEASSPEAGKPSFRLYAYRRGEEPPSTDARRIRLPRERLAHAVDWALFGRGYDVVLIEQDPSRTPFDPDLIHHVCADSGCPGGCNLDA